MSVEPRMCPITYRTHLYKGCPLQSLCYTVIRDRICVGSCVRGETELRESNGTESERIALEERTCYNGVVQHIIGVSNSAQSPKREHVQACPLLAPSPVPAAASLRGLSPTRPSPSSLPVLSNISDCARTEALKHSACAEFPSSLRSIQAARVSHSQVHERPKAPPLQVPWNEADPRPRTRTWVRLRGLDGRRVRPLMGFDLESSRVARH